MLSLQSPFLRRLGLEEQRQGPEANTLPPPRPAPSLSLFPSGPCPAVPPRPSPPRARPLPPVTPMLTEAALSGRCGEGWWLVPLCLQLCPLVGDSEGRWRCEGARVCDVAGSVTSLQQVPPAGNSAQDFRGLGGSGLWRGQPPGRAAPPGSAAGASLWRPRAALTPLQQAQGDGDRGGLSLGCSGQVLAPALGSLAQGRRPFRVSRTPRRTH